MDGLRIGLAVLLLATACGASPIDSASTCTELANLAADLDANAPGYANYREAVIERAEVLGASAAASGANYEVIACIELPDRLPEPMVFETVPERLDG